MRTVEVLRSMGRLDDSAVAELTVAKLPNDWKWGVFCGLEEVLRLFEGKNVDIWGLPEGTLFRSRTQSGVKSPLLTISGPYSQYCIYETPMLGFLCHSSGVSTMAARCKRAARGRSVMAFGIRRMHPSISPMLDRSSYIGGCDGVSSIMGAESIGQRPDGTMPHALVIMMDGSRNAFKAFDEIVDPSVPRIALIDTYTDEKTDAIEALNAIKDLFAVRLDTPGSRRGSFPELIREVRWELDIRGGKKVKIVASGGLDDITIPELLSAGADGFGVGTSISNAPTVDFALDIVEKDGRPVAKRGKFGGRKYLHRCPECLNFEVSTDEDDIPSCVHCGTEMSLAETKLMSGGKRSVPERSPNEIRSKVLEQVDRLKEFD